jgi:hypothetical protein
MSQFPHDQFAKDLLESLLSPFGKVETDRKISSEVREIDVCFFPYSEVANLPPGQKSGIVVIHQLPATLDTLWLRVLGKKKVQQRAIEEINRLDVNSPYRQNALELLSDLRVVLERNQNRNNQDTELLMSLKTSQPYLEH